MSVADVGRMSAWELMEWAVFEREFGPLTVQERIDAMSKHVSEREFEWRSAPTGDIIDWLKAKAS